MSTNTDLTIPGIRRELASFYRHALLDDVIPFWLRHGLDPVHGGILTALDRDGSLLDSDKSVWFQGRASWMFATLYNTVEKRSDWLEAARSCVEFMRRHCYGPYGKMYFSVTQEGKPLRMRRYVFSESFAAVGNAAYARATGDARAAEDASRNFETYLRYSFDPGVMTPKFESTRPMKGLSSLMIGMVTAQELRVNLGDIRVKGKTCTEWIDLMVQEIERDFFKPDLGAVLEAVALDGSLVDHLDGRILNPGHTLECAWFIMHEGRLRKDQRLIRLGLSILDCMWMRGWDTEFGGLLYYADVFGKPVQEYWHDMKFWWPHCEGIIATSLAYQLTGDAKYARWHAQIHDWSFAHFPDSELGEWYGYLRRDGTPSQHAKGNLFKGPFHLPRMLWYCSQLLEEPLP